MPARATLLAIACCALLAACGGGGGDDDQTRTTNAQRSAPSRNPLALPPSVPVRSVGPGDRAAIEVIRAWADALRASDIDRAASFWGLPAQVQNGSPVLKLATVQDVRTFNKSLECGSILTSAGRGDDKFTIVKVRLTNRPGEDCRTGGRNERARTAIRVVNGKIVEWYRLPDDPDAPKRAGAPARNPVI